VNILYFNSFLISSAIFGTSDNLRLNINRIKNLVFPIKSSRTLRNSRLRNQSNLSVGLIYERTYTLGVFLAREENTNEVDSRVFDSQNGYLADDSQAPEPEVLSKIR